MRIASVMLAAMVLIPIGLIILQIYLSKRENKWLGLIMPLITFGFSLITVLGMINYLPLIDGGSVMEVFVVFISQNIPTAVLSIIYIACKEKLKKRSELDKMNIQDL